MVRGLRWHGQTGTLAPGFTLSLAPYSRDSAQASLKNHVGLVTALQGHDCLPPASTQGEKAGRDWETQAGLMHIYVYSVAGFRGTHTFTAQFITTSLLAQQHKPEHHQNQHV